MLVRNLRRTTEETNLSHDYLRVKIQQHAPTPHVLRNLLIVQNILQCKEQNNTPCMFTFGYQFSFRTPYWNALICMIIIRKDIKTLYGTANSSNLCYHAHHNAINRQQHQFGNFVTSLAWRVTVNALDFICKISGLGVQRSSMCSSRHSIPTHLSHFMFRNSVQRRKVKDDNPCP